MIKSVQNGWKMASGDRGGGSGDAYGPPPNLHGRAYSQCHVRGGTTATSKRRMCSRHATPWRRHLWMLPWRMPWRRSALRSSTRPDAPFPAFAKPVAILRELARHSRARHRGRRCPSHQKRRAARARVPPPTALPFRLPMAALPGARPSTPAHRIAGGGRLVVGAHACCTRLSALPPYPPPPNPSPLRTARMNAPPTPRRRPPHCPAHPTASHLRQEPRPQLLGQVLPHIVEGGRRLRRRTRGARLRLW